LLVLIALVLAACGGGSGGGGNTSAGCPADGCSVEETSDVAYVEGEIRTHRKPLFDVYAPAEEGPWPVVVIAPGTGSGKGYAHDWATAMASQGVVVFAVEYEIGAPQTPLPHLNCAARYVRDVADEYGGDPSHVTLLGYSLGAIFGAPVSLGVDELPPTCLASEDAAIPDAFVGYEGFYGVGNEYLAEEAAAAGWPDATTLVGGNPDLVVRLIHGGLSEDPVATSEEFTQILADAGYDVEFMVVEGAAHTGVGSADSPAFDVIVDTTLDVAGG
jgi:acetyl esterase/lipase